MRAELANTRSLSLRPETGDVSLRAVIAVGPKGDAGADGSNVLPTDTAISEAIENPASLTAGALSATFAQKASPTITGDAHFARMSSGDGVASERVPSYLWNRIYADQVAAASPGGDVVGYQRTSVFHGDWTARSTVTITATGGTFTATIGGQTTAPLAYNISAAALLTALQALSSVGSGYLTVTGGPGGTAPLVVSHKPKFIRDYGYQPLTLNGASLTGPGHGINISTPMEQTVDTGYVFGAADYHVTSNVPGEGGIAFMYGHLAEAAIRNDGLCGFIAGATSEVSWSGANGIGQVGRMIGHQITAGRHKNDAGAGILPDGAADEVYGLFVNGAPEGRTVTDAVTTNGSPTVTSATAKFLTLAHRGRTVTGTGIPANTYILAVNSPTQVTLSNNCTASGTITMTLAAIAGATTARTATFGPGTVEIQGRSDHKPTYKPEPAARFYAFPGAASNDPITEWYDTDGTTRKVYITNLGVIAGKHRTTAHEGSTDGQVSIGSNTTELGAVASVFYGTDNNVYMYRPAGYKVVSVKADNSVRVGHAVTGSVPSIASRGAAAADRSAHLFVDETLDKLLWSSQTAWKEAANVLYATATLDFPSVAAGGQQELTITVTGAATGDAVVLAPPAGFEAGLQVSARVSAANTVTIRVTNPTGSAIDPASASWKAMILR